MTQLATRDAEVCAPTGVVTVADLLSRYGPVPTDAEPDTGPVSVQSLLLREGATGRTGPFAAVSTDDALEVTEYHGGLAGRADHAEHAGDAGYDGAAYDAEDDGAGYDAEYDARYEHEDDEPRRRHRLSGITLKHTAIAAGVLVAAGSVVGATVATTSTAVPAPTSGDQALPEAPSRSWLDPAASVPAPSVAPVVSGGALDAGDPVDTSWMEAGFPAATAAADDEDDVETAGAADDRDAPATAERQDSPAEPENTADDPEPAPATPTELVGEDDDDAGAPEDSAGDDDADAGDGTGDDGSTDEDDETAGRGEGRGDQGAEADGSGSTGTDGAVADGGTDEQAAADGDTAQL